MKSINISAARKDIYNLVAEVNENREPIMLTTSKGKGAVLVGEDYWESLEETLYLLGVPGMLESLLDAENESPESCIPADQVEW